jgi:hypothetical protein
VLHFVIESAGFRELQLIDLLGANDHHLQPFKNGGFWESSYI